MTIKARFILSHLLAALLPFAVLAAFTYAIVKQRVEATMEAELAATAADNIAAVENHIWQSIRVLRELARHAGTSGGDTEFEQDSIDLVARNPELIAVMMLSREGRVIAASRKDLDGMFLSTHAQVRVAREGRVALGPVTVQPVVGRPGIAVAMPIPEYGSDRSAGILLAYLDWSAVETYLSQLKVLGQKQGYEHRLVLSNKDGILLWAGPMTVEMAFLTDLGHREHSERLVRMDLGSERFLASAAHSHASDKMPDLGWNLMAMVQREAAYASVGDIREVAAAVGMGAALLAVGIGFLAGNQLVRPVQQVTRAFQRISEGDLTATLDTERRHDEIGDMAKVLQVFRDQLINVEKLSRAVEQSPASVVITDRQGTIQYVNPKFVSTTGYRPEEVIGQNPRILKSGYLSADQYRSMWDTLLAGREWRGELYNKRKDGSLFWEYASISAIRDRSGEIANFLAVKEDITVRKGYEEELLRQANYDSLTGLPNRLLALDRMRQAIQRADRHKQVAAAILLDLDRLRTVNDTLGHEAGDDVLRQAAARMVDALREEDTVARLGGDEFLVIVADLDDAVAADTIAGKLAEALIQPFLVNDQDIVLGASCGIAIFPEDGMDPQTLFKNADAALYLAKESGRNARRFFTPDLHHMAKQRLTMEEQLRTALDRGEFEVYYHPQINVETGRVDGAEALLRWHNPQLGTVSPNDFIPLAEETDLIVNIGTWVLDTVCADLARLDALGLPAMRVAINVSSRQFENGDLPELVALSLAVHGLSPDRLEVEVTERLLLDQDGSTRGQLDALKDKGVRLSIDDFGTGYSSMSYLTSFRFDVLKIDQSFVRSVAVNPQDAALAQAIIAMAHALGLEVVAEGVEDEAQALFMGGNGCEFLQGFHFSRPLPFEKFADLVRAYDDCAASG